MWQVLYPDSYVVPEPSRYGTFTTSPGQTEDATTFLTPFHDDFTGDFWNADTVRTTEVFGYTYAETANTTGSDAGNLKLKVTTAVNNLYGTSAPANTISKSRRRASSLSRRGGMEGRELAQNTSVGIPHDLATNGQYREWIANIRVSKYALESSFFIHIFLGDFNPDPATWSFEPNLVGSHCVFAMISGSPANAQQGQQVTGTVPLTSALLDGIVHGRLDSLDLDDVEPYLLKNLHWRVSMVSWNMSGCLISTRLTYCSLITQLFPMTTFRI